MSAPNAIAPSKLVKLIGVPAAPTIIDVTTDDDFAAGRGEQQLPADRARIAPDAARDPRS